MTPSASFPLPARSAAHRILLAVLLALGGLAVATSLAPTPAQAANVSFAQCNNVGPGPGGATTGMTCDVTIVNTIDGPTRGSTVTVSRQCSLDPCPGGNVAPTTTSSSDLVTSVSQCNSSGNDAAHTTTCTVRITNNISSDTPGATPVTGATVNQCVGSAQGGGGSNTCNPFPASTTNADITQCNGSANGGGGTIDCHVPSGSTVSPALPVTVNQCNGTGNPGGSTVRCTASITTNITAPSSGSTTGGTTGGSSTTGGTTGGTTAGSTGGTGTSGTTGGTSGGTTGGTTAGTTGGTATGGTTGSTGSGSTGGTATTGGTTGGTTAGTATGSSGGALDGAGSSTGSGGQVTDVPVGGVAAGGGSTAGGGAHPLLGLGLALLLAALALLTWSRVRAAR